MFVRAGLALIAVQRGDLDSAREQYAALAAQRGTMLAFGAISADRLLGLLSQTLGRPEDGATHFEDAVAFCRKAGYRPELAWSLFDYGDMLLTQAREPADGLGRGQIAICPRPNLSRSWRMVTPSAGRA